MLEAICDQVFVSRQIDRQTQRRTACGTPEVHNAQSIAKLEVKVVHPHPMVIYGVPRLSNLAIGRTANLLFTQVFKQIRGRHCSIHLKT
jgi:hypothetical protein